MPRPDERVLRKSRTSGESAVEALGEGERPDKPPSKTRRKAAMHVLQHLGESLVVLDNRHYAELAAALAFPDALVEAIRDARTITAWGARKRQLQYIGRLMREIDPEPIRKRLELLEHGRDANAARQHALEQWRDRLLAEPAMLDRLAAEFPRLDRPRFKALIHRAREERDRGAAPRAFRELFRELRALDAGD